MFGRSAGAWPSSASFGPPLEGSQLLGDGGSLYASKRSAGDSGWLQAASNFCVKPPSLEPGLERGWGRNILATGLKVPSYGPKLS